MSKGQTKKTREAAGNRRKLTRAEKKQIAEAIRKAKGDGKARTAQQTIPYLAMYPDGICKVTEKRYSKCVVFEDINYQLAQADDKTAIFENWCDFLNYFDASVSVQLSFINQGTQREQAEKAITTFLVVNMADTKRKLENDIFAAAGIAQKYNCRLTRLDYQQEAGLLSSVPIGENLIPIQRGLTTSSTAIFIPFITQELFQTGQALYYGLNALSNNMITPSLSAICSTNRNIISVACSSISAR